MSTPPKKEAKDEDEEKVPPRDTWAYDLYYGWWL